MKLKPAENHLAIEFVDGEEEADEKRIASGDINDNADSNALLATVVAVGPGVKVFKEGQVVLVRPWCRYGVKFGDVHVVESWSVLAAVG